MWGVIFAVIYFLLPSRSEKVKPLTKKDREEIDWCVNHAKQAEEQCVIEMKIDDALNHWQPGNKR